jgi:hypothetical protein
MAKILMRIHSISVDVYHMDNCVKCQKKLGWLERNHKDDARIDTLYPDYKGKKLCSQCRSGIIAKIDKERAELEAEKQKSRSNGIEAIEAIVTQINNMRYMNGPESMGFRFKLEKAAVQLGDESINYLNPLWDTWPSFAEDAIAAVFLSTGSYRSLSIILNLINTADYKLANHDGDSNRNENSLNTALHALHTYAKDPNNQKHTDTCIKAIRNIAKKKLTSYSDWGDYTGNPIRSARICLEDLTGEKFHN